MLHEARQNFIHQEARKLREKLNLDLNTPKSFDLIKEILDNYDILQSFKSERIKLKHGTARVHKNISNETIEALNKMSEIINNMGNQKTMTPQEKAKELVQKYIDNAYQEDKEGLYTPIAKQCALIAVDEIMKEPITIYENTYYILRNVKAYWEEVKTEIEKL